MRICFRINWILASELIGQIPSIDVSSDKGTEKSRLLSDNKKNSYVFPAGVLDRPALRHAPIIYYPRFFYKKHNFAETVISRAEQRNIFRQFYYTFSKILNDFPSFLYFRNKNSQETF